VNLIITGDWHLHSRNRQRMLEFRAFTERLSDYIDGNYKQYDLVVLGDVFDRSAGISWSDYHFLVSFLRKWRSVVLVIGNHDCRFRTAEPIPAFRLLEEVCPRPAYSFSVWHYYASEPTGSSSLLFAHKDFQGLHPYWDEEYGITMDDVTSYKLVFLGHLHFVKHITSPAVVFVVGPPYPTSLADRTPGIFLVMHGSDLKLIRPNVNVYTTEVDQVPELLKKYRYVTFVGEEDLFNDPRVFFRQKPSSSAGSSASLPILDAEKPLDFYRLLEDVETAPKCKRILRAMWQRYSS